MNSLQALARRIHRWCVILMMVLGLTMALTGTVMKFSPFFLRYLPWLDTTATRSLHNLLSPFFAVLLLVMMVTGGYMFIYPWWLKWSRKSAKD